MPTRIQVDSNGWKIYEDDVHVLSIEKRKQGQPPVRPDLGLNASGAKVQRLLKLGSMAIRFARREMKFGPFNNRIVVSPGLFGYRTDLAQAFPNSGQIPDRRISPRFLYQKAEMIFGYFLEKYPDNEPKQMAGRAFGSRRVGGGVCSMMTYVTAGILSMLANELILATVYDDSEHHEYCLFTSATDKDMPWFVADPWVGRSVCCAWNHNKFVRKNVTQYSILHIHSIADQPFGIELAQQDIKASEEKAKIAELSDLSLLKKKGNSSAVDPRTKVEEIRIQEKTEKGPHKMKKKTPGFEVETTFQEQMNCPNEAYIPGYYLAAGPYTWGTNDGGVPPLPKNALV